MKYFNELRVSGVYMIVLYYVNHKKAEFSFNAKIGDRVFLDINNT